MVELDRFLDELAEFLEDFYLVEAMASAVKKIGAAPDVDLVFFGPLN